MARNELENFTKTFTRLQSFLATPIVNDRERAGVIQAFEFTFEQCWRSLQKLASRSGGQVGNAKQAFTFAIQSGWIPRNEEMDWIRMIEYRNLTSHTYKQDLAEQVLERVQRSYVGLFQRLHLRLVRQTES